MGVIEVAAGEMERKVINTENDEVSLIELGHKLKEAMRKNEQVANLQPLCISINYISCIMEISPEVISCTICTFLVEHFFVFSLLSVVIQF